MDVYFPGVGGRRKGPLNLLILSPSESHDYRILELMGRWPSFDDLCVHHSH
jgi:hypothetical protein